MLDIEDSPEEPGPSREPRDWHAWWRKWRRRRHFWASLAALITFFILTLLGHSWGLPSLIAAVAASIVLTIGYFHYRRRQARAIATPTTPARDPQRMPPKDIEFAVILRDKGKCQLRYPGICLVDQKLTVDHIYPWSKGGSSTDMNNLQTACRPCNQAKGARVLT